MPCEGGAYFIQRLIMSESVAAGTEMNREEIYPIVFSGKAGEYFRIWIVNVLLSIVTLGGVYSAWAKVRRKRYFYGSTALAGSSFEYHADPKRILVGGRIIVLVMYIVWLGISNFTPPIVGGLILLVFVCIAPPVIINKSLKFNAVNSSYRNLRFNYSASYKETFITFVVFGIITSFSFGLLVPYYIFRMKKHVIERSRYGTQHFQFTGRVVQFYIIYGVAVALVIGTGLLVGVTVGGAGGLLFLFPRWQWCCRLL